MIAKLMKNYAVSEQGAKDMIKSVCICILVNIALMLPTGLLYVLAEDILNDAPFAHARMLLIGSILTIALLGILYYMQYNATFFAMYQESGNKRISLAEKLRRMPLSFFDQKDSADLTTVILGDVAAFGACLFSSVFTVLRGCIFHDHHCGRSAVLPVEAGTGSTSGCYRLRSGSYSVPKISRSEAGKI